MAAKRTTSEQEPVEESARFDPRLLVPVAGAALAAIGPAVALGGRAVLERREREARASRAPLAILGVAAAATGAGVVVWRFRDQLLGALDRTVATVIGVVTRLRADDGHGIWEDDAEASAAAAALAASAAPGSPDAPTAPASTTGPTSKPSAFDANGNLDPAMAGLETGEPTPVGARSSNA